MTTVLDANGTGANVVDKTPGGDDLRIDTEPESGVAHQDGPVISVREAVLVTFVALPDTYIVVPGTVIVV